MGLGIFYLVGAIIALLEEANEEKNKKRKK